jgi:uncharacterized protein YheU (UPF0270 family)
MVRRCGQAISSGAMEASVWSAKLLALSFRDGMRRPAAFSPRPRWRRSRHLGVHRTALGTHAFGREKYEIRDGKVVFANEGPIGIMVTEKNVGDTTEPTLRDLSEVLVAACGTDYGIHNLTWISRFTDMSRQAAAYRKGRVLWLAMPHMCILRWADKASTPVCRMQ